MASATFQFKLVVILGAWAPSPPFPGGRVRVGTLFRKSINEQTSVQDRLAALNEHAWTQTKFIPNQCVKQWSIARGKGPVPEGPILLGRSWRRRYAIVSYLDTARDTTKLAFGSFYNLFCSFFSRPICFKIIIDIDFCYVSIIISQFYVALLNYLMSPRHV